MPHKTFFAFILPSLIAMVLFIALPIVSVVVQSFYVEHGRVLVEVENCQPFGGCTKEVRVDAEATAKLETGAAAGQVQRLRHLSQPRPSRGRRDRRDPFQQYRHRRRRHPHLQPAVLQGAGLHAGVLLRRDAARHGARLRHRAGGQHHPQADQGAGDLLFAAADDHHAAGRLADPLLDDPPAGHPRRHAPGRLQRPQPVAARLAGADLGCRCCSTASGPTRPSRSSCSTPGCRPCRATR